MKKGFYKILIILMTLALLGLIVIQLYWAREALIASRDEFDGRVYQAMTKTAEKINQLERDQYYQDFGNIPNAFGNTDKQVVASSARTDSASSTHLYITRYVLERTQIPISERYNDSVTLANLYKQERSIRINRDSSTQNQILPLEVEFENTFRNSSYSLDQFVRVDAGNKPIQKRINFKVLDSIFIQELGSRGIFAKPEVAIISRDASTVLMKSEKFINQDENPYVTLFTDAEENPSYLFTSFFPDRSISILGKIIPIMILTVLFVLVIITAFALAIYYMQQQRRLSQVKTDFINNMTHELKTPLATISLATDALKSDKIINNQEKIKHYSNLIKQENKRMNHQVEMVLRMSRLERNEIDLNTKKVDLNELIAQTVEPIRLIVEEERNGTVFEDYKATRSLYNVDPFHFSNIILNILENANKYSPEEPQIYVKTYNNGNQFIIEVEDKGMGMHKNILNKIFEQFYRAETGNIHNVKGQGLGLAYVKKIVELHHGTVWAESEKGKGSKFFIQLP